MADNVTITQGSGTSIGADDITNVLYQRIKLIHGADGTNDGDVSTANPLPVELTDNNNTAVSNIGAIKTAVEVIDNPVSGSEMLIAGGATQTNDVKVTLDSEAVVLGGGSASIGKLGANSGVDIGDVDVTSLPADTFVAEDGSLGKGVLLQGDDGTDRHNVAVDTSGLLQVDIAADSTDLLTNTNFAAAFGTAGSADSQVMSVQGIASMTALVVDATSSGDVPITLDSEEVTLATGSNAIGKLAANSGVDIGDVDVTSLPDAAPDTNYFTATITSADATTATQVKAKTAAKDIHVTSLMISVGSTAMEVQLQSDNGTPQVVMEEIFLAANGGIAMSSADKTVPLFIVNTNEDLDVITSAAGDVTVMVSGYVV